MVMNPDQANEARAPSPGSGALPTAFGGSLPLIKRQAEAAYQNMVSNVWPRRRELWLDVELRLRPEEYPEDDTIRAILDGVSKNWTLKDLEWHTIAECAQKLRTSLSRHGEAVAAAAEREFYSSVVRSLPPGSTQDFVRRFPEAAKLEPNDALLSAVLDVDPRHFQHFGPNQITPSLAERAIRENPDNLMSVVHHEVINSAGQRDLRKKLQIAAIEGAGPRVVHVSGLLKENFSADWANDQDLSWAAVMHDGRAIQHVLDKNKSFEMCEMALRQQKGCAHLIWQHIPERHRASTALHAVAFFDSWETVKADPKALKDVHEDFLSAPFCKGALVRCTTKEDAYSVYAATPERFRTPDFLTAFEKFEQGVTRVEKLDIKPERNTAPNLSRELGYFKPGTLPQSAPAPMTFMASAPEAPKRGITFGAPAPQAYPDAPQLIARQDMRLGR
jgi:hypothetical protein